MCSSSSRPLFCCRPGPTWWDSSTSYLPVKEGKLHAILRHRVSWLRVTSVLDPQTLPQAEEGPKSPTLLSTHCEFSLQGLKDHWQSHFLIFPLSSPNHQALYSSLRKQQRPKREKASTQGRNRGHLSWSLEPLPSQG